MWLLLLAVLGFASDTCQGWEVVGELLPDGRTQAAIALDDDRVLVIGADQTQVFSVSEGTAVAVDVPWKPKVRDAALTRLADGRILGMVTTSQKSNKAYEDFHCVWWAGSQFDPAPCITLEGNFYPVMPRLDAAPDGGAIAVFGIGSPWVLYPPHEAWTKLDVSFHDARLRGVDDNVIGHTLLPAGELALVTRYGQVLILDLQSGEVRRGSTPPGMGVQALGNGNLLVRETEKTWLLDESLTVREGPSLRVSRDYGAGMHRLDDGRILVWGHSRQAAPNRVVEVGVGGASSFQYGGELCGAHPGGVLVEIADQVLIVGGYQVSTVERWKMGPGVGRPSDCELRLVQLRWDLPIERPISWERELDPRERPELVQHYLERLPEPLPDHISNVDCSEYPCVVTFAARGLPTQELADAFDDRWFTLDDTAPAWSGPDKVYRALAASELSPIEARRTRHRLGHPDLAAYAMPEPDSAGDSCESERARLEWELAVEGRLRTAWPEGGEPVPEQVAEELRRAGLDVVEVHCEERPCVAVVVGSDPGVVPDDLRALPEATVGRRGERWVVVFSVGDHVTDPAVARRAIRRMQELARPVE